MPSLYGKTNINSNNKTMENILRIKVPITTHEAFINNVGYLRYREMIGTIEHGGYIDPVQIGVFLDKEYHTFIGFDELDGQKYALIKKHDKVQTLPESIDESKDKIKCLKNQKLYTEHDLYLKSQLIANTMVNWALDNIGNPNANSGSKFDEVFKNIIK